MARIYEQQGNKSEAIDHYQQFITLWSDCDAELRPLLEEAQRAVERLQGA